MPHTSHHIFSALALGFLLVLVTSAELLPSTHRTAPAGLLIPPHRSGATGAEHVSHSSLLRSDARQAPHPSLRFHGEQTWYQNRQETETVDPALLRRAGRLQRRLSERFHASISLRTALEELSKRQKLLKKLVMIEAQSADQSVLQVHAVSLQQYPHWLHADISLVSFQFILDEEQIRQSLLQEFFPSLPPAEPARLTAIEERDGLLRAVTNGIAKPGYTFETKELASAIKRALLDGTRQISVTVAFSPGTIVSEVGLDLGELQFLATGRSDFAGSGLGRKHNVRKGLQSHVHNVLVPPGEVFSFNKTIGNMARDPDWELALGIFNGGELRPIAGGGICQVATTVYRAILNAGFPVVQRANHSLFVSYYVKYGVGIDATVFPGSQDLVFLNDSPRTLLIQAYADGEEAIVNLYGTPDGRQVALEGPYFTTNAPEDLRINGRQIYRNEIVWIQQIRFPDGREARNILVSRYKELPKKLKMEYAMVRPGQS